MSPSMRSLVRAAAVTLAFAALAPATVWPAAPVMPPAEAYALRAPLELQAGQGLHRVALPWEALRAARRDDLADLMVLDAQGRPVPSAWAPPRTETARREWRVLPRFAWPAPAPGARRVGGTDVQVRVDARGAVVEVQPTGATARADTRPPARWLLDASGLCASPRCTTGAPVRLAALDVQWPAAAAGETVQATVESSDDLQSWRAVAQASLVDLPGAEPGQRLQERRLPLPEPAAGARYLRLTLEPAVQPTQIRAEVIGAAPEPAWPRLPARFDAAGPGVWTFDAGAPLPLRRLHLDLPPAHSVVPLRLERRAHERDPWQPVVAFTAYRLLRDGRTLTSPPVDVEAPPARWWRLRLASPAGVPAEEPLAATLEWQPPQLVFAAEGPRAMLAVGHPTATAPRLPLSALLPGYRTGDEDRLPEARPGPAQTTAPAAEGWRERWARSTAAERRQWLLWAVLAATVAALLILARRLARDLRQDEPASGSDGR